MKTIKQIADEIGVTKQAVHQKRKSKALSTRLQPFTSTVDGVVYISFDGETLIKQAFKRTSTQFKFTAVSDNAFTGVSSDVTTLIAMLQRELEVKTEQINTLQSELAEERQHSREQADKLALLADQAQKLHAGTIHRELSSGSDGGESQAEPEAKRTGIFIRILTAIRGRSS